MCLWFKKVFRCKSRDTKFKDTSCLNQQHTYISLCQHRQSFSLSTTVCRFQGLGQGLFGYLFFSRQCDRDSTCPRILSSLHFFLFNQEASMHPKKVKKHRLRSSLASHIPSKSGDNIILCKFREKRGRNFRLRNFFLKHHKRGQVLTH